MFFLSSSLPVFPYECHWKPVWKALSTSFPEVAKFLLQNKPILYELGNFICKEAIKTLLHQGNPTAKDGEDAEDAAMQMAVNHNIAMQTVKYLFQNREWAQILQIANQNEDFSSSLQAFMEHQKLLMQELKENSCHSLTLSVSKLELQPTTRSAFSDWSKN